MSAWPGRQVRRGLRRLRCGVCRRLYRNPPPTLERTMLVAGMARSGTTWIEELIGSQVPCRRMFEPFYPFRVRAFRDHAEFVYRRPADSDPALEAYAHRVLTGRIRDRWIDADVDRIFPKLRFVKAVRASLFLTWLHRRFPEVRMVLLVRHPGAIARSWMRAGWDPRSDLRAMLDQPSLVADHLEEQRHLLSEHPTVEEQCALLWSIQHRVLMRQFEREEIPVVFYEDLCIEPERAVADLFGALGLAYTPGIWSEIRRPSRMSATADIVDGHRRVARWRDEIPVERVDRMLAIVEAFGLGHVYGESTTPAGSFWPGSDSTT